MTAVVGAAGVLALSGSQALTPNVAFAQSGEDPPALQQQEGSPTLTSPTLPTWPTPLPFPSSSLGGPGGTNQPYGLTSPSALTSSGIPEAARRAYVAAAAQLAISDPSCQLKWSLVAGIGRVESNHGRYGGSSINANGLVTPPILGIKLDGSKPGTARITDSDNGRYDGDTVTDRAVGPMQFLPGTWKIYGAGANPQDMNAAALATAKYLCAGSGSLATQQGRWAAVYRYNHSDSYVSLVLSLADSYAAGTAAPFPSRPPGTTTPPANDPPATPPGPPPSVPKPTPPPKSTPKPTGKPKPTNAPKPPKTDPPPHSSSNPAPNPSQSTSTPKPPPTTTNPPGNTTPPITPTCSPAATVTPTPTPTSTPAPTTTTTPTCPGEAPAADKPTSTPTPTR